MVIHNLEQRSEEWFNIRLGKVTGSVMKDYFDAKGKLKSKSVLTGHISKKVSELLTGENVENKFESYEMEHGTMFEEEALENKFADGYETVGFVTSENDNISHFGVSPDSILTKGEKVVKAVEVKCPTNHVHTKYAITKQVPNEYKGQIGLYFVICSDIEEITFLSYCPNMPDNLKRVEVVVTRDSWSEYLETLESSMIELNTIIDNHFKELSNV